MYIYRISLKYEITRAQLLMKTIPSQVEITTEKNGYQIDAHPIKMKIDNAAFFQSIGIKPVSTILQDSAARGEKSVLDYIGKCSGNKNAKLGPHAMTVAEIAAAYSHRTIMSSLDFIPKERPQISWEDGYVDIDYKKDERTVNRTPSRLEFEYIPYKVEIFAEKLIQEYPPEDVNAALEC
jgi:hypothetical protein